MTQIFKSGKDLFAEQQKGVFNATLTIEGMIKPADQPDAFMFNPGTECVQWIQVADELIEQIEFVKMITCKDHEHPYVRITLKQPAIEDTIGQLYVKLLSQSLSKLNDSPYPNPDNPPVFGPSTARKSIKSVRCKGACIQCTKNGNQQECDFCDACRGNNYVLPNRPRKCPPLDYCMRMQDLCEYTGNAQACKVATWCDACDNFDI